MRKVLAFVAAASLVVACSPAATPSPTAPKASPTSPSRPVETMFPAPTAPEGSWLRLEWESVVPPSVPVGAYVTNVLSSNRGLLVRVLERPDSELLRVQTTADGRTWVETTAPPESPLGSSVDGLDDWLQLMIRGGDDPGVDLLASTDGVTWALRGRLPDAMDRVSRTAVVGRTIVACGAQKDKTVSIETCAVSTDAGATWRHLPELDPVVGSGKLLGVTATAQGFLLSVRLDVAGVVMGGGATSRDGLTWEPLAPAPGLEDLVPDIYPRMAAVAGRHVLTGAVLDGRDYIRGIWTTFDGRSWTRLGLPRVVGWVGDVYASGDFAVVTAAGGTGDDIRFAAFFTSGAGHAWRQDELPSWLAETYEWWWHVHPVGGALLFFESGGSDTAYLAHAVPANDPGPTPAAPASAPPEPSGAIPPTLTWETAAIEDEGQIVDVAAWPGGLIAVGDTYDETVDSLSAIWTSPDGVTWSLVPKPRLSFIRLTAVAAGVRLVAAGTEFTPHVDADRAVDVVFWYSDDGRSWTRAPDADDPRIGISPEDTVETGLYDIVPWRGGFVAVGGASGMPARPAAWFSGDGVRWTRVAVPGSGAMLSLAPLPSALLAVGTTGGPQSEGRVWRSEDGRTWERVDTPAGMDGIRVAAEGGRIVATGWGTRIWSSTDAEHWREASDQPSLLPGSSADRLRTIAAIPSGFVAAGARTCPDVAGAACPAAWTSADAVRWTRVDLPSEDVGGTELRLLPVASVWLGDRLVVIGAKDMLLEQGWRVWVGRPG